MKRIKTCLRTPGGKFYGFKHFKDYFDISYDEYREPFIGGGSVFLSLSPAKKLNWVNDLDTDLINFYKVISDNKDLTFSPKIYGTNEGLFQNEYRQQNKNSSHILDFSLKKDNNSSKSHFFSRTLAIVDFPEPDNPVNQRTQGFWFFKFDLWC